MSLEMNKAAAAVLTAGVVAMFGGLVSDLVFPKHDLAENAYPIEVTTGGAVAAESSEPAVEIDFAALIAAADPAEGEKGFKKCAACHSIEAGGPNKVGPNLHNLVGGPIGGKDFAYSDRLTGMNANGDVWSHEALVGFLKKPRDWAPGTKMSFGGLKKPEDIAEIIAYMRANTDNPPPVE